MISPYADLPPQAFWQTGVANQTPAAIDGLYKKKFSIDRTMRIATAGSCFAQHITQYLRKRRFSVIDEEPPPPGLDAAAARRFGYGLYSARYANIYTTRQLRQFAQEALGEFCPADAIWEKDGRYYDAMRPSVEPSGLSSPEVVLDHRACHLQRVLRVLRAADVFIITLGLTEAWEHAPSGTVYPTAPGTVAGKFDPAIHRFHNFNFKEVYEDLSTFFEFVRKIKKDTRFVLSVSPVPLTATASEEHVLRATTYSKSILRAVAGQLYHERADVDYVPSYELITSSLSRGQYFAENLRTVRPEGVEAAMKMFFAQHDGGRKPAPAAPATTNSSDVQQDITAEEDVLCEEALLEAFAS
jgi:hypothetical protein